MRTKKWAPALLIAMLACSMLGGTCEAAVPGSFWIRHLFTLPQSEYDRTEAAAMENRILKIEPSVLESLVYAGVRIKLVNGRITDEPEMAAFRGVVPRGWEGTGLTWDDIPGVGGNPVIVRIGYSDNGKGHGSRNLELHETSHAIDAYVFGKVSSTKRFLALFRKEAPILFAGTGYEDRYPEEYFAEAVCMYYLSDATKAELAVKAPDTLSFLNELFASHRAKPEALPALAAHWARVPLERLSALGVLGGFPDGSLRPGESVTRAQFMKLLAETLGLPSGAPDSGAVTAFTDVKAGSWAASYVEAGETAGILIPEEYGGVFEPSRPLTRAEMAVWTARALSLQPDEAAFDSGDAEVEDIAGNRGLIGAVVSRGIMAGMPGGRFEGSGLVTRAQAAAVLDRILDLPEN